jgi:hypothetical protein
MEKNELRLSLSIELSSLENKNTLNTVLQKVLPIPFKFNISQLLEELYQKIDLCNRIATFSP